MAMKDISDAQVCRAVQAYQDAMRPHMLKSGPFGLFGVEQDPTPPFPYEALAAETGQAEKVCYRAMERAYDRGLIECGVSLRTGWLTPAGRALVEEKKVSEGD
jgi:hypothetical protein